MRLIERAFFGSFFVDQILKRIFQNNIIQQNTMSNFDPFFSCEYVKKQQLDQMELDSEPIFSKKSESQFISELLHPSSFSCNEKQPHTQQDRKQGDCYFTIQYLQQEVKQDPYEHSNSQEEKTTSKNSIFHNFQKHLCITLKHVIDTRCIANKLDSVSRLACKLFQCFKKSKKTSRKFLEEVYGMSEQGALVKLPESVQNLRKGELKIVFEEYSNETILMAQQLLRNLTKCQLLNMDISEYLSQRKIQKKNQFIAYVNLFAGELTQGKLRKKAYKQLANSFPQKFAGELYYGSSSSSSSIQK